MKPAMTQDMVERVAVRLQDRSLMPTMNIDVTIIGDVDVYWTALAQAAIEATGVVELRSAADEARILIGAKNDNVSDAVKESNINQAWHLLNKALTQLAKGSE